MLNKLNNHKVKVADSINTNKQKEGYSEEELQERYNNPQFYAFSANQIKMNDYGSIEKVFRDENQTKNRRDKHKKDKERTGSPEKSDDANQNCSEDSKGSDEQVEITEQSTLEKINNYLFGNCCKSNAYK